MKALEKAEAKLKQKLEKRNARSLYEGSKLMEAQNNKKSYEELFLEVNPLNAIGTNKGKSKDIHIEMIDVSTCAQAYALRSPELTVPRADSSTLARTAFCRTPPSRCPSVGTLRLSS